ncbi:MAG: hypothetical protein WBW71_07660, partial [Bacteroidota bacterium]
AACVVSSESGAVGVGAMRALRKRLACAGGKREPFSLSYVQESIASIPILRSSLCFFLWRQRKKDDFKAIIQNESLREGQLYCFTLQTPFF